MSADSPTESEQWRPVVGFEGLYSVSNFGRIRSHVLWNGTKDRLLRGGTSSGYPMVKLRKNRKYCPRFIHRIVLEAFLGLDPNRPISNHKNGNRADCRLTNLEWCTSSENLLHAYRVLNRVKAGPSGERNSRAKLTEAQVLEIRERYKNGATQRRIGEDFGVARPTVSNIVRRGKWAHI